MVLSKKIYFSFVLSSLVVILNFSIAFAAENCVLCGTELQGMPLGSNSKILTELAKTQIAPFASYQDGYCKKFTQIEINIIEPYMNEMEKTPYPVDDYFLKLGCQADGFGSNVKSPLLHLIGDDPDGREKYAEYIYNYYLKKVKNVETWKKAINAKNSKGQTTLDYIEFLDKAENYELTDTRKSIQKVIAYICSKGAVYSYYPDKKCP